MACIGIRSAIEIRSYSIINILEKNLAYDCLVCHDQGSGSGSGFQIFLDPDPVSAHGSRIQILGKKHIESALKNNL